MLEGRDVSWSDQQATLVVSQAAARQFWPGQSPIGKRIAFGAVDTLGLEIVGVVADAHSRGLTTDAPAMVYMAYQGATRLGRTMSIVVRGRGDVAAVTATTKEAMREIDRTLPVFNVQSVSELVAQSVGQSRLNTILLAFFALIAVVLAVIGIYGVVSYSVTQRTQEIGVRMALGARQADVLRLVLREGAALAAIGVAIGVAGAYRRDAAHSIVAVRDRANGFANDRRNCDRSRHDRVGRELFAGAPCVQGRSASRDEGGLGSSRGASLVSSRGAKRRGIWPCCAFEPPWPRQLRTPTGPDPSLRSG